MNLAHTTLVFIVGATLFAYGAASEGWLGPYGLPGDNLHLILLVAVLTFTFLTYIFVSEHQRGGDET